MADSESEDCVLDLNGHVPLASIGEHRSSCEGRAPTHRNVYNGG